MPWKKRVDQLSPVPSRWLRRMSNPAVGPHSNSTTQCPFRFCLLLFPIISITRDTTSLTTSVQIKHLRAIPSILEIKMILLSRNNCGRLECSEHWPPEETVK